MEAEFGITGLPVNATAAPSGDYRLENGKQVELGRARDCDICFGDETVSRKHALLTTGTNGEWYVYDLKSSNGTYVNGQQITAGQQLRPDDVIGLGPAGPAVRFVRRPEVVVNARPDPLPTSDPAPVPPVPHVRPGGPLGPRSSGGRSTGIVNVFPFLSGSRKPLKEEHVVLGLIAIVPATALAIVVGFLLSSRYLSYAYLAIVVCFFVTSSCTALLSIAGRSKPWYAIIAAGIVTAGLSIPFFAIEFGGDKSAATFGVPLLLHAAVQQFITALPIAAGVWIGRQAAAPWRERFGIFGPLDGLSIGLGSAAGFELVETLQPLQEHDLGYVLTFGLTPLIRDIAGQLAFSGYIGYLIGLGVTKPKHRVFFFFCGWSLTTLLSAVSDSLAEGTAIGSLALSGVVFFVSFVLLVAAIYRARVVEGLSQPLSAALGRRP